MKKLSKFSILFVILFSLSSCSINLPKSTVGDGLAPEIISSVIICVIGCILFTIIGCKARKADPLAKPKGILNLAEMAVEKVDKMVVENMGKRFEGFAGYIMVIFYYVFFSFIFGLTGLQSPMNFYLVPLSVSLITFILIQLVSVHYKGWKYFHKFIEPFPIFLPINLISFWAPLLSMSFRLFGNAIAGYILMDLIYDVLGKLSTIIFHWPYVLGPIIAPIFHAYFDLFSGAIQTLVFAMLTMLLIAQEGPSDEAVLEQKAELK